MKSSWKFANLEICGKDLSEGIAGLITCNYLELKTSFNIVEAQFRFFFFFTLMSVLYNDVQKDQ